MPKPPGREFPPDTNVATLCGRVVVSAAGDLAWLWPTCADCDEQARELVGVPPRCAPPVAAGGRMNRRIRMATLLLRGEWLLDDAVHRIGGDRFTPDECRDTARALEELAAALREYARESEIRSAGAAPGSGSHRPSSAAE
ncbi:hypothetical protein GCM10027174_29040 [Salinifilum aidingensis]